MQKVYLLRNNRKSGPFTLPDLLLQSPQPDDLLWIEGQSTGWTRLSDLELNLPAAEDNLPTPETAPNLEAKAEALRRRALDVPPRVFTRMPQASQHIAHEEEPEEEPILFIDHRKQKNNIIGEVLMTVFIVALLGGGFLGGRRLFHAQESDTPAVTRMSTNDDHAATASPQPVVAQSAAPVSDSQSLLATAPAPTSLAPSMPAMPKHHIKDSMARIAPANPAPSPDSEKVVKPEPPKPAPATHTEERSKAETPVAKTATTPANDENAEPQKKKGLGQAIKNLFRKKKKDDTESSDQH